MSDQSLEPMDPFEARLARDLREASSIALRSVDPAAQATEAALTHRSILWPRRRSISPVLLIAALAVALALIVVVASIGSSPRPLVEAPTVQPSFPAVVQVASPSPSGTPRACMTDTVQVLTGAAMGPVSAAPASLPGLGTGRGVFTTTAPDARISEIWSVGQAGTDPTRIGEIRGGGDVLDVLSLSRLGSKALLRIGEISPGGASPECGDLYLAATDGSGIQRLTHFSTRGFVAGGAISPDASRVAYATWTEVGVIDLATGETIRQPGCTTGYGTAPLAVVWSSVADLFAVACETPVIYDPAGSISPVYATAKDTMIGIGWARGTLMVGESSNGPHQNGFHVDAVEPSHGRTIPGPEMVDTSIDWVVGSGNFSPSGQRLIAEGYVGSDDALYLIDAKGGAPRRIAPSSVQGGPFSIAWSSDERAILFADVSRYPTVTLTHIDVATGKRTSLGTLPTDYDAGAWQVP